MRVDYYHTGNAKQELFSLDRVVVVAFCGACGTTVGANTSLS